jgi:hypothetical protein
VAYSRITASVVLTPQAYSITTAAMHPASPAMARLKPTVSLATRYSINYHLQNVNHAHHSVPHAVAPVLLNASLAIPRSGLSVVCAVITLAPPAKILQPLHA